LAVDLYLWFQLVANDIHDPPYFNDFHRYNMTCSLTVINGYDVGLAIEPTTPGRIAIKWLVFGWVTLCRQVNYLGILSTN